MATDKELYHRRKNAGICVKCGKSRVEGSRYSTCENCREKARVAFREYEKKSKQLREVIEPATNLPLDSRTEGGFEGIHIGDRIKIFFRKSGKEFAETDDKTFSGDVVQITNKLVRVKHLRGYCRTISSADLVCGARIVVEKKAEKIKEMKILKEEIKEEIVIPCVTEEINNEEKAEEEVVPCESEYSEEQIEISWEECLEKGISLNFAKRGKPADMTKEAAVALIKAGISHEYMMILFGFVARCGFYTKLTTYGLHISPERKKPESKEMTIKEAQEYIIELKTEIGRIESALENTKIII